MGQEMFVCPECGLGFLGADSCPRCHSDRVSDGTGIQIPWVHTGEGWAQQRIDGSTWLLGNDAPIPASVSLGTATLRNCAPNDHPYVGTDEASCPSCPIVARGKSASVRPTQSKVRRWRGVAVGAAVLLIPVVIIFTVGAIMQMLSDPDREAIPSDDVAAPVAPETTTITVVIADPEFVDAVAYEAALSDAGMRAGRVANQVLAINDQWDKREITQEEAARQLDQQASAARSIEDTVNDAGGLGANVSRNRSVADAAHALSIAIEAVSEGLREPGSRAGRDEATIATVGAADLLLEAADDALRMDQRRLRRDIGTIVPWESLRIADCVDASQDGEFAELVACAEPGAAEVLAVPVLPSATPATPLICTKAAWPHVEVDRFDPDEGSWDIRDGVSNGSALSHICLYQDESSDAELVVSNAPHTGPFVSDQWDALARIDLVAARPFEVGDCFEVPPDDEPELVHKDWQVDCEGVHDFSLSAVLAVAPPGGATSLDRLHLRSSSVCAETASNSLGGVPYLVADAVVIPTFPDLTDEATPMMTLACVLQSDEVGGVGVSLIYQSGYAFSFIATQAGVFDFGYIENPESEGDIQYNLGISAGQDDVLERRPPSVEITDKDWIAGYLRGNRTGWQDGRGCDPLGDYPVPPGMDAIEMDGWFRGYNAGFSSACNVGAAVPSWVGRSVCPYDPWEVDVITQDILCPPVKP